MSESRLKVKWEEGLASEGDFYESFIASEIGFLRRLIARKEAVALRGTMSEISASFELECVFLYGILTRLSRLIDLDFDALDEGTHVDIKLELKSIHDLCQSERRRHLVEIPEWNGVFARRPAVRVGVFRSPKAGLERNYHVRNSPMMLGTYKAMWFMAKEYNVELFLFSLSDVDVEKRTIRGLFMENGKPVRRLTTYPDLVENRYQVGDSKASLAVCRELMKDCRFLKPIHKKGKQALFDEIVQKGGLKDCGDLLIPTHRIKDFSRVEKLLSQYSGEVIVKPDRGASGKGVCRLSKEGDRYRLREGSEENSYSADEIEKIFQDQFLGKYVLQPVRESRTSDGSPFDIRVLIKRRENGEFFSRSFARVGQRDSVVSNVGAGGYVVRTESFIAKEFGAQSKKILARLNEIGRKFGPSYQEIVDYEIYEIGLDIGITKNADGTVGFCLYEINSSVNWVTHEVEGARASLEYFRYLADVNGYGVD